MTQGASEQGQEVGGMSARAASQLAWALCALSLALTALSLLLLALNLSHPDVHLYNWWLENTAMAVRFSIVGAISSLPAFPPAPWAGSTVQRPASSR